MKENVGVGRFKVSEEPRKLHGIPSRLNMSIDLTGLTSLGR